MILETLTLIAGALNHPTYGVAAKYATIPTASLTVRVVPPVVIASELTHAQLATDAYEGPFPALLVMQSDDVQLIPHNASGARDSDFTAVISYRGSIMPQDVGVSSGLLTMKAVQRCIESLFADVNEPDRGLNGVYLWDYHRMTQSPMLHNPDDNKQSCTLKIEMMVRDTVL